MDVFEDKEKRSPMMNMNTGAAKIQTKELTTYPVGELIRS